MNEITTSIKCSLIEIDYYDEEEKCWAVDCWREDDIDQEDGFVAAYIYDNGFVDWNRFEYAQSAQILAAIGEFLNNRKDD